MPPPLVLVRLSIIWLVRKITHILKKMALVKLFIHPLWGESTAEHSAKLSSTKHRPRQDKSVKLTRSQKVKMNHKSLRPRIIFAVSKELLYFMYFSAKRKNMFSQILRWPKEGRKHIVISLLHHGIVREWKWRNFLLLHKRKKLYADIITLFSRGSHKPVSSNWKCPIPLIPILCSLRFSFERVLCS